LACSTAPARGAILLEIPGVRGEITRAGFTDQFACSSFRFTVDRTLTNAAISGTADVTLGVGELGSIILRKKLDSSSAFLLRKGISGSSVGTVTIRVFAEPSKPRAVPYLQISLDSAFIKSWVTSGRPGESPIEEIQIWYNKISLQNAETSDGLSPTVVGKAAWDQVKSKPWTDAPSLLGFINVAPVVATDVVTRKPGTPMKIAVASLLGNDSDPDGDVISFDGVTTSGAPGASVSRAGKWIYYTSSGSASDYFRYSVVDEYGASTTGQVNVMVDDVEQKLDLAAAIEHMPGAADLFRLSFNGIPGLQYRVFFSSTIAPEPVWELLGTVNAADNGLVNYVDTSGASGRLYRVVYP
jgi:type VI protein secretion system component Hcp